MSKSLQSKKIKYRDRSQTKGRSLKPSKPGRDPADGFWANNINRILERIGQGLRYSHLRINANTSKGLESTSFLYALIELLEEKNLLSLQELDERKKQVAERLAKKFQESGLGLMYQYPEYDKYTFAQEACVNCLEHLPVCKAICCKFSFALSKQDVEEGIIRWDFGRPYLIAHDEDGYCVHLDRQNYQCTVRDQRPVPCRGFDCRHDPKWPVWQDFEHKILNGELVSKVNNGDYHA